MKVYIIHESPKWTQVLTDALDKLGVPHEEWMVVEGVVDLTKPPPEGIFYNRMSPSSHGRGHQNSVEYTTVLLAWLDAHGRTVFNGTKGFQFEINKAAQDVHLRALGVRTPRTIAAIGGNAIIEAALSFPAGTPFLTKHNRAGSGLGIRLVRSVEEVTKYVRGPDFQESRDGVTLVQEFIESPNSFITRLEFVEGQLVYGVRVQARNDNFNLCPADSCQANRSGAAAVEKVEAEKVEAEKLADDASSSAEAAEEFSRCAMKAPADTFTVLPGQFDNHPLVPPLIQFLARFGPHCFNGVEFIEDVNGDLYVYDVNWNTNYNQAAEHKAGVEFEQSGMGRQAQALKSALLREFPLVELVEPKKQSVHAEVVQNSLPAAESA